MKLTITLLFIAFLSAAQATPTYTKLCEVNQYWKEQKDINFASLPQNIATNEKEWIRLHLTLVEQILRARSTAGLTEQQRENRLQCLNYLHDYWQAGNFPINEDYDYRTPIFIDRHDNFCAVGYLVKASGYEEVSRMIAAQTNLAYVRQMHYPELNTWAAKYGFTIDELAWIQPGYPSDCHAAPLGKGTNGQVTKLFADNAGGKLFVAGSFTQVDGTVAARNIAAVTESGNKYTWQTMGTGVNGPVYAMALYNGNLFVGGHFDTAGGQLVANAAYWDGSTWHSAGCTYGTVKDFVVYKGDLYAVGHFDVCAALAEVNLAKWTGTMWQQIPGVAGTINTVEVNGDDLVLGGRFNYMSTATNIVKYNSSTGFQAFGNNIMHEVKDLQVFKDTLYAVCKKTGIDAFLFQKLKGNVWEKVGAMHDFSHMNAYDTLSVNALCADNDTLAIGGDFHTLMAPGTIRNYLDVTPQQFKPGAILFVDSTINAMAVFKGKLIVGGYFKKGEYYDLGGIGYKTYWSTKSIKQQALTNNIKIYPNPVKSALTIENNFNATQLIVTDATGKQVAIYSLSAPKQQLNLNSLASGIYFATLQNEKGITGTQQFIIE